MAEQKHTPGPWRALCGKSYTRVTRDRQGVGDETGSVQICHIAGPEEDELRPFNKGRWEADARLIAAAPELLEALKAYRIAQPQCECSDASGCRVGAARALADAAIAKAEGRS